MKVVEKDRKVEVVAETIMRYAGDAFSDARFVTGRPTCTAEWPKDFSRNEQVGFRIVARAVLDALEELDAEASP